MTKITIDGTEFELEDLSQDVQAHVNSLRFVESEITRLNMQLSALQTARNAYGIALKKKLPTNTESGEAKDDELGDTISFD